MKLPVPTARRKAEPTITLINVVFLMLIFFLVAGTLSPMMDSEVSMIDTSQAERTAPPEALSVRADGTLHFRGQRVSLDDWAASDVAASARAAGEPPRIIADRNLPASDLVALATDLRAIGFERIAVVTERGAQ